MRGAEMTENLPNKDYAIVLVTHGMPPKDFPAEEKKEYMRLRGVVQHNPAAQAGDCSQQIRHDELEAKMRAWPRNEANDSFYYASREIGEQLEAKLEARVFLGFNEFCAPSFETALEQAASSGVKEIRVLTPMLTRGGNHAEEEIPEVIEAAKKLHPSIRYRYAWPFSTESIVSFLADQVNVLPASCSE